MLKQINKAFLQKHNACFSGVCWFLRQKEKNSFLVIDKLIKEKHIEWAIWLIVRLMNKKQKIHYAIFAAEYVINICKKKHIKDDRPQKAIQAAKNYLKNPCKKTKTAVRAAHDAAAHDATVVAYVTANATVVAYVTANATVVVATADATVVVATVVTAYDVATVAAYDAAKNEVFKILNFGIKLLNGGD